MSGSDGGGIRHCGAAEPRPSDAGSLGARIWAVGCGRAQRQKEDEVRRAPRKGTRRGGKRPDDAQTKREKGGSGTQPEREAGVVEKGRAEPCTAEEKRSEGSAK